MLLVLPSLVSYSSFLKLENSNLSWVALPNFNAHLTQDSIYTSDGSGSASDSFKPINAVIEKIPANAEENAYLQINADNTGFSYKRVIPANALLPKPTTFKDALYKSKDGNIGVEDTLLYGFGLSGGLTMTDGQADSQSLMPAATTPNVLIKHRQYSGITFTESAALPVLNDTDRDKFLLADTTQGAAVMSWQPLKATSTLPTAGFDASHGAQVLSGSNTPTWKPYRNQFFCVDELTVSTISDGNYKAAYEDEMVHIKSVSNDVDLIKLKLGFVTNYVLKIREKHKFEFINKTIATVKNKTSQSCLCILTNMIVTPTSITQEEQVKDNSLNAGSDFIDILVGSYNEINNDEQTLFLFLILRFLDPDLV